MKDGAILMDHHEPPSVLSRIRAHQKDARGTTRLPELYTRQYSLAMSKCARPHRIEQWGWWSRGSDLNRGLVDCEFDIAHSHWEI